ncbi:hypothetical protein EJ08DRAFT_733035 [Tothia fuscella]|uniref:Exocyst complex component Sec3 PIP2-binding N-terminal domain-containing protein n=1 Tax=Tothia fuscella TaxID=1048955 RepID=A0A9P4NUY1_9PEZI|nr:hypothetical protein EJ08DRAFT_733035 [Tothia fuscella]
MDGMNRFPRGGGLPSGPASGMRPQQRPGVPPQSSISPPPAPLNGGTMTRAERFEDEKSRIIESLFTKTDETGQLAESYITHIRVTEDAQYPQTPHPPDSPTANKERMIIVSVKNTGRVRMHKARENGNRTFSIGKTWSLDDLSAIQSWQFYTPRGVEESQLKEWAGETGFTVTLAKPYFWQGGTAKEKEFFIQSLVKIYKKYTKGQVPELIGFPPRELEAMAGSPAPQSRGPSGPSPSRAPQPPPFSPDRNRGPSFVESPRGPPDSPYSPTPQTPDTIANQSLPPMRNNRGPISTPQPSPGFQPRAPSAQSQTPSDNSAYGMKPDPLRQPRAQISRDEDLRQVPSREQLRPMGVPGPARLTPQSSRDFRKREGTPDSLSVSAPRQPTPERRSPSRTREESRREHPPSSNGLGIVSPVSDYRGQNGSLGSERAETRPPLAVVNGDYGSQTSLNGSATLVNEPAGQPIPERKRPPMMSPQSNGSQASFYKSPPSQTSTPPILSPNMRRDIVSPPARETSTDSVSKAMPGAFVTSPPPDEVERDGLLPGPLQPSGKQDFPKRTLETIQSEAEPSPAVKPPVAEMTAEETKDQEQRDAEELARPGLGRMFGGNKKTAQNLFKSAAKAYGAFVPRAGGAGANVSGGPAAAKSGAEPDGISGVFPAPGLLRTRTDDTIRSEQSQNSIQATPTSANGTPNDQIPDPIPQVTVSSPLSPEKESDQTQALEQAVAEQTPKSNGQQVKAKVADEEAARRKKRRSAQQTKYLSLLGIDSSVIDNRGLDFESMLDDFGWGTSVFKAKSIDVLEADIRREISRVEAGSWLGHLEQKDERVESVERLLEKAVAEVDELEGLLTLYSVELGSLNEDIAFIEAQSQGLQVQTANQKLLQTELTSLIDTISIQPDQLAALRRASPGNPEGLESIERVLLMLYKAMVTIDPAIRQGVATSNGANGVATNELSTMTALQEKGDAYLAESAMFLKRMTQFLDMQFGAAMLDTKDHISRGNPDPKLSVEAHDIARNQLWQFGPLLLFAKEIDVSSWDSLMKAYQARARDVYQPEIRDNFQLWMKLARKPTGDEQELLFTFNEKEDAGVSGITANARKMTVKRSATLAKGLRNVSGDKARGDAQSGSMWPFEVFAAALDEATPLISTEQNFFVDFFHATSKQNMDFTDAVTAAPPEARRGTNIRLRKPVEPDRAMAKRVADGMTEIYSFFPTELQNMMDWGIKADPLQGIGIMHALHRAIVSFDDTNQDFLTRTLTTLATRLTGLWMKFVEEQIKAIEETKVKIKKRKGVIGFIKIFPNFSAAIENMLPSSAEEPATSSEVRAMVDTAYGRMNKAMFESLRVIAKDSRNLAGAQPLASGDPEDKEALNYHILLIENMNHYIEEVDERDDTVLMEGRIEAKDEMAEHLNMYVDAVIRRPLGKVIDFIETLDHATSTLPAGTPPSALSTRPSTSHSTFRKLLSANDSKELRRGIEGLRKRIDKHFGNVDGSDELGLSRELVGKVLLACEHAYLEVFRRVQDFGREVYEGEEGVAVLGNREEVGRWFRGGR